ncbi:hypothetical protein HMPREF0765_1307 [Sphingobacterium spiritivorum ATCC 33300]|uniref:Uncharacterized protein n=1 Tax=Sphingobacterium spiritivorum ATCC 33300 TaxID=525372 RepID=C2FVF1_SPHSI|nr:hypothetical protein HMPREF0765_1307 [Sphingobacterium spiritivorum ATCC 33300]
MFLYFTKVHFLALFYKSDRVKRINFSRLNKTCCIKKNKMEFVVFLIKVCFVYILVKI